MSVRLYFIFGHPKNKGLNVRRNRPSPSVTKKLFVYVKVCNFPQQFLQSTFQCFRWTPFSIFAEHVSVVLQNTLQYFFEIISQSFSVTPLSIFENSLQQFSITPLSMFALKCKSVIFLSFDCLIVEAGHLKYQWERLTREGESSKIADI